MLKAIYKTGSSLLLKNNRDVDYVHFYETKKECIEQALHRKCNKEHDIHYDIVRPLEPFFYCYLWHFMELVEGEDLHLKDFNMFKKDNKAKYLETLRHYAKGFKPTDKKWYHILIVCFMYQNGKYELTEEQLTKVQNAHDNGISDSDREWCLRQITAK